MKQRLVGTIVLLSLASIVISLLLDGEGVERPPLTANVPPAPIIDTTPLPEPARPAILADTLVPATTVPLDLPPAELSDAADESAMIADDEGAAPAELEVAPQEPPESTEPAGADLAVIEAKAEPPASTSAPALDAAGLPEAWVVRVGVFGEKANAERLTAQLALDNFKSFVRPVGVSSGVFIGPVATRNEATAIQQQLNAAQAKYQIGSVSVQRFDIAE